MCSVIFFDRLRTSVDNFRSFLPLLCKEGSGEVEPEPEWAERVWSSVLVSVGAATLPHLASPYKGEGKPPGTLAKPNHSVNELVDIYNWAVPSFTRPLLILVA